MRRTHIQQISIISLLFLSQTSFSKEGADSSYIFEMIKILYYNTQHLYIYTNKQLLVYDIL